MSAGPGQPPPAGWYPDPTGGPNPRWWDGWAWTNTVRSPDGTPTKDDNFRREDTGSKVVKGLLITSAVVVALLVLAFGACIAALSQAY